MTTSLETIDQATSELRKRLADHPLYGVLTTPRRVAVFMEHHIWAVWDFMSVVKALQRSLTCVSHPWRPLGNPEIRYLINDIVTGEESDLDRHGQRQSHFEIYLRAMAGAKASTASMERFLARLEAGSSLSSALVEAGPPPSAARFVRGTMSVIDRGRVHELASLFTFGREEIIPAMFLGVLDRMGAPEGAGEVDLADLRYYLNRHIEVDQGHHGPLARRMVELLIDGDSRRLAEATQVAETALLDRLALWDGVVAACQRIDHPEISQRVAG